MERETAEKSRAQRQCQPRAGDCAGALPCRRPQPLGSLRLRREEQMQPLMPGRCAFSPCSSRCCQRTLSTAELRAKGVCSCSEHTGCGKGSGPTGYADPKSPLPLKRGSVSASCLAVHSNTFRCAFGSAHARSHAGGKRPGQTVLIQGTGPNSSDTCIFTRKKTVTLEAHEGSSLCQGRRL